jgi:hypothetical protein
MAITRRNTLVLLFVVVAAAGVIGGTGAFSTVEADRTVSVATAGDSGANVQFQVNTGYESLSDGGGPDTIGLNFDGINLNANTTYDKAMNVTINNPSVDGTFTIDVTSTPTDMNVEFENGTGSSISGVSPGETESLSMTIDTTDISDNSSTAANNVGNGDLTFEVRRTGGAP